MDHGSSTEGNDGGKEGWLARTTGAFAKARRQRNCQDHTQRIDKSGQSDVGTAKADEEVNDRPQREQRQFELLYSAEMSARYHRRRATFLTNADIATNAITLCAGATSLGGLMAKITGPWPVAMAAVVTLTSIIKIVTRLGSAANSHTAWFRRWSSLLTELELSDGPSWELLAKWRQEQGEIERDCVAELRALCIDCENVTARKLGVEGRQRRIGWWQRRLIQIGTWQAVFPIVPDVADPIAVKYVSSSNWKKGFWRVFAVATVVWIVFWSYVLQRYYEAWIAQPLYPAGQSDVARWLNFRDLFFDGLLHATFWPLALAFAGWAVPWVYHGFASTSEDASV